MLLGLLRDHEAATSRDLEGAHNMAVAISKAHQAEIDGRIGGQAAQFPARLCADAERPRMRIALPVAANKRRPRAMPHEGSEELCPVAVGTADEENIVAGCWASRIDGSQEQALVVGKWQIAHVTAS